VSFEIDVTVAEPDLERAPDQPPDAVQSSAFVLLHESVVDPLRFTALGDAVSVTVGAAPGANDTLTLRVTVPPAPAHPRL
jgi:hypothetical protein